jgi:hypothetical protein
MPVIALDRRFVEWKDDGPIPDFDFWDIWDRTAPQLGWDGLLAKQRVVILAESGSGKSTEMQEQVRLMRVQGKSAFYVTVTEVASDGLEASLRRRYQQPFQTLISTETSWILVDSADEAKANSIRIESAFLRLAEGIQAFKERVCILLSCRVTDWEPRSDLELFARYLPVVGISQKLATPQDELLRIVRQESRRTKAEIPAKPMVVLMAPLNADRVRRFAEGMNAPNVAELLEEIQESNLWLFARRPLDLEWLVKFWQHRNRFGSLSEMLETSIAQRLKENAKRARQDTLDPVRVTKAIERIGAAMVFGRKSTIPIPDSKLEFPKDSPLDLADILPDWSPGDRSKLLTRPIFDPATLERARFHNDNEGTVRSYLTARWLMGLRAENLTTGTLFEMLFARSYGLDVVKPSMEETATWLAVSDQDVGEELLKRSPASLLFSGDPASLSLDLRCRALTSVIEQMHSTNSGSLLGRNDRLRRFAQPDLSNTIHALWKRFHHDQAIAEVLLRIIWLGKVKNCAGIAAEAALGSEANQDTRLFAGRALMATADEQTKKLYAAHIMCQRKDLDGQIINDAFAEFFPRLLSVSDLLAVLEESDLAGGKRSFSFKYEGPSLANKLASVGELKKLIQGLLLKLEGKINEQVYKHLDNREEAYFPALAAATCRLLKVTSPDDAPEIAVKAAILIGNRWTNEPELNTALTEIHAALGRTSSRRRSAFWHAAEYIGQSRFSGYIDEPEQMRYVGYSVNLQPQDIDWLIDDGLGKADYNCRLAVNSALGIAELPAISIKKIARACKSHPAAREAFDKWNKRRRSGSPRRIDQTFKLDQRQLETEMAERDGSWVKFAHELPSDPSRIAKLREPGSREKFNPDLASLWKLLDGASDRSTYAVDDLGPLERIFGKEVATAAREGLTKVWRSLAPAQRTTIDLIGLVGLSLEASAPKWAERLSRHEATAAVGYAVLELNRLPPWLRDLAVAWPAETVEALMQEIRSELSTPDSKHYDVLGKIAHTDDALIEIFAPALLNEILKGVAVPPNALSPALQILERGLRAEDSARFVALAIERFNQESELEVAAHYVVAIFNFDPQIATNALLVKLATLSPEEKKALFNRFLELAFSDAKHRSQKHESPELTTEVLDQLARTIFQTNTHRIGSERPSGVVYNMRDDDRTDWTRNVVLNRLAATPGAATFRALLELEDEPDCYVSPLRLRELAETRAVQDSESEPWPASEAFHFEKSHETAPRTARDLQTLLLRRIEEMHHELLHGDSGQGLTLKNLKDEVHVQNFVHTWLRNKQGRSFSAEREPHVAGEKEPDIRFQAKGTNASVAMEIKVAESWTLPQLEAALDAQLCGKYLRAKGGRHGILLLVYQDDERKKQWHDKPKNQRLSFAEVVTRLSEKAAHIAREGHDSPQPEVCGIDVTNCQEPYKRGRKAPSKNSKKTRPITKSSAVPKKDPRAKGVARKKTPKAIKKTVQRGGR